MRVTGRVRKNLRTRPSNYRNLFHETESYSHDWTLA